MSTEKQQNGGALELATSGSDGAPESSEPPPWQDLFPPGVAVSQTTLVSAAPLHPAEEAYLRSRKLAAARIRDFRAGRTCARVALETLGAKGFALLPTPSREPRWPGGIVGSITHTEGLTAAAAARETDLLGLGLDAEQLGRIEQSLTPSIASPAELERKPSSEGWNSWLTLHFSAKESVFKAVFPICRQFLDFRDVELDVTPETGQFAARLLRVGNSTPWIAALSGRYWQGPRHVVTTAVIANH